MDGPHELTDIQRFYKNSTVFLTGATGFIGKLLLEKILRALAVKKVFILVRKRKQELADERFHKIFESKAFDRLKRSHPDALQKVFIMEGDCSLPMLGMSEETQNTFIEEVNVVFHVAASVRFDEPLKKIILTNVRSTRDLIGLSQRAKNLKMFAYIGTAYSNCNRTEIKEEVYPAKIPAEKLIAACENLEDDYFNCMTEKIIDGWPNTYTFSKQVVEDYINRNARKLPICIVRPTVVISTLTEPVSAFVDNVFTISGYFLIHCLGTCRISYYQKTNLDLVPADFVVNQCIAAGWQTGELSRPVDELVKSCFGSKGRRQLELLPNVSLARVASFFRGPSISGAGSSLLLDASRLGKLSNLSTVIKHFPPRSFKPFKTEVPIYNVSSAMNPITQDEVWTNCYRYGAEVPSTKMVLYPLYFRTTCKYNYIFFRAIFHTLVAYILDLALRIRGKAPRYADGVAKLHKFQESYEFFATKNFFIHVENTHKILKKMSFKDRELFNFDVTTIDWENYFCQYAKGMRFYLLDEPIETIPEAIKRATYLRRIFIVSLIIGTICLYVIGKIFLFRLAPAFFSLVLFFIRSAVC